MPIPPDHPDYLTPAEYERLHQQMTAELKAIVSAIGYVTAAWGRLEECLFDLFSILSEMGKTQVAGVVFYTPSNMETRLSLVDKLITYQFEMRSKVHSDEILRATWKRLRGKINNLKDTRNMIAHGTIMQSIPQNLPSQRPRLTPSFFHTLEFRARFHPGQHVGLGSAEIETHHQAVNRAIERFAPLIDAVRLQLKQRVGLNPTEAEKLRGLLTQLDSQNSSQNNQNLGPPDTSGPGQSSQPRRSRGPKTR